MPIPTEIRKLRYVRDRKIIFVIDSGLAAIMSSILLSNLEASHEVEFIYEIKEGISDGPLDYLQISSSILSHKKDLINSVKVPSLFHQSKGSRLKDVPNMRNLIKNLRKKIEFDSKAIYIGSSTSVIMKSIPNRNNLQIDHGAADHFKRLMNLSFYKRLRTFIKRLYYSVFGMSGFLQSSVGFTLAEYKNDHYSVLDYRDYKITDDLRVIFENTSDKLSSIASDKNTLVLPYGGGHTKDGFIGDTTNVDHLNISMIQKHCGKDELLLLKFSPNVYHADFQKKDLVNRLDDLGFKSIDVDEYLPNSLRGAIPAEIYALFFNISKLVSVDSTTLFNISLNKKILPISETGIFIESGSYDERYSQIVAELNKLLKRKIIINNQE